MSLEMIYASVAFYKTDGNRVKKYWNESKAELNVPQNTKNYNLND